MRNLLLAVFLICAGCLSIPEAPEVENETLLLPTRFEAQAALGESGSIAPNDGLAVVPPASLPTPEARTEPPVDVVPVVAPLAAVVSEPDVPELTGSSESNIALPSVILDEFTVNKDMRLGTVLRALARIANVNIAFGDSVENLGPFRFRLNNPTPWNEVLESILNVYHLSYEVRGKIITIMTLKDMSLRYNLEKQKSDQFDLKLRRESMSPLVLKVIKAKYVKAESMVEPLTKLLQQSAREDGGDVRGSVSFDESSNSIILNAPQTELVKLNHLIDLIDRKTRQIRIEATLVEVSTSLAHELGVKWAFHGNERLISPSETRAATEISPMSMDSEGAFTLSDATYHTMQGLVDTAEGTIDYGIIGSDFAVGMNLNALAEDGKLKILSRPSLTTMDNRKAVIKSGSDIPFQTEDEDGRSVVEYKEAVLSLDVRPQIVDDVAIFMDVAITKDEPDFTQAVDGNPLVIKKYVESRMMVLDGQTAVIAGLTKSSQFKRDGGLPFLRKIPLLGWLAATKLKENSEEELMIFLTPRIIPNTALDNSAMIQNWMRKNYYEKEDVPQGLVPSQWMAPSPASSDPEK